MKTEMNQFCLQWETGSHHERFLIQPAFLLQTFDSDPLWAASNIPPKALGLAFSCPWSPIYTHSSKVKYMELQLTAIILPTQIF